MKKIETFKSFSQLQNQIREESKLKEIEIKRGTTVSEFNSLLQKYNAASVADLNEEDRVAFMAELTKEGNAFGAARAEAIAKGDKEFEVDGEKVPVKNVDKEDEENAEEFVDEAELSSKANPRLYTKVENKLKSQKYNSDAEYHLTLLKAMDPKKLSRSDLDTLSDFDDMYESVVTEAVSNRIKITYEEIRTIVDLANASIAAKNNNINGVFGYTLVSIFGDKMDRAEWGPVTITVDSKAAGAVLALVDWADQDKSNVKNTAYTYGITSDDLRKKFAYGEIVESLVNENISPEIIAMISTVLGIPTIAMTVSKLDSALEKAAKNGNEFAKSVLGTLRSAGSAASSSMRSESLVTEAAKPKEVKAVEKLIKAKGEEHFDVEGTWLFNAYNDDNEETVQFTWDAENGYDVTDEKGRELYVGTDVKAAVKAFKSVVDESVVTEAATDGPIEWVKVALAWKKLMAKGLFTCNGRCKFSQRNAHR